MLIIVDSTYDRSRSKFVELLARIFDHNSKTYLNGFKLLTLGWSDGVSFLPLDFVLRSSAEAKKRIQEITKAVDKRTCGYRRWLETMTKSTELVEDMIKRVLALGIKADYIFMDSWFFSQRNCSTQPSCFGNLHGQGHGKDSVLLPECISAVERTVPTSKETSRQK